MIFVRKISDGVQAIHKSLLLVWFFAGNHSPSHCLVQKILKAILINRKILTKRSLVIVQMLLQTINHLPSAEHSNFLLQLLNIFSSIGIILQLITATITV